MLEGQDHLDTTISVFKDGSRQQWHELDRDMLLLTVQLALPLASPLSTDSHRTGPEPDEGGAGKGWRAL